MTTTKETKAGVAAEAPVKKARRGVSNETKATSQLRFHEKDAAPNGLFMAHLHSVSVEWSTNSDGKQFTGEKVPRLQFEFASNTADANEMRHAYQSLFPVESNVNTIPGGSDEWKVNQVLSWIKHVLDVYYLKGRKLTEAEEDALSLPFMDFDDDSNFVALDVKEILGGYAQLFSNVVAMMNGTFGLAEGETAKPCYRDDNGKFLRCWIKILRFVKSKGEWKSVTQNGDLGFPMFVGTGCIELAPTPNYQPKIISYDSSKESITPKEVKKAPAIPGMAGTEGGVMAGMPGMGGTAAGSAYNEAAAEDMPF